MVSISGGLEPRRCNVMPADGEACYDNLSAKNIEGVVFFASLKAEISGQL